MRLRLINRSGYTSASLRAFFERGLRAIAPRAKGELTIVVTSAPGRSRGCASVGGRRMVIAMAPPSRFRLRRLSRLFLHELRHILGDEHEDMEERVLYSLGSTCEWAKGARIVYAKRAPNQVGIVRCSAREGRR